MLGPRMVVHRPAIGVLHGEAQLLAGPPAEGTGQRVNLAYEEGASHRIAVRLWFAQAQAQVELGAGGIGPEHGHPDDGLGAGRQR